MTFHHQHPGACSLLEEDFDSIDADDVELIQRVRETGVFLAGDRIGSWCNPAATPWYDHRKTYQRKRVDVGERREVQDEIEEAKRRQLERVVEEAAEYRRRREAERRAWLECRCFDIAVEAAGHWHATDVDARLMWNMLRYMNLGAGCGKEWDPIVFSEAAHVPLKDVKHCYNMLRRRNAGRLNDG